MVWKKKSPLLLVLQEKEDISSKRKKSLESALHEECWNRFWLAWSLFPKKMWIKLRKRLSRISKTSFCSRVGSIALHYQFLCLTCLKQPLTQFAIKEEFSPWIPSPPKKSLQASSRSLQNSVLPTPFIKSYLLQIIRSFKNIHDNINW